MANTIKAFINQKHDLGHKYEEDERYLLTFDKMCSEKFPTATTVTREVALAWAEKHPEENRNGFSRRVAPIRELARYIQRNGHDAFIIPKQCGKVPFRKYVPYIFTKEELKKLFYAADNIRPLERYPLNHLTASVILRLIYSCGLRPYEARLILRENIDLNEGTIFIPESKKFKDRIVVMDETMLEICRDYNISAMKIFPQSLYFFPAHSSTHSYHDRHWLALIMSRCLLNSGIYSYSGKKARPYDLRHTYATHTLFRWLAEGRNLNNCLPYLSAYMGHEKFHHTAYYIHLVPEFFPDIQIAYSSEFEKLLPEVIYED